MAFRLRLNETMCNNKVAELVVLQPNAIGGVKCIGTSERGCRRNTVEWREIIKMILLLLSKNLLILLSIHAE